MTKLRYFILISLLMFIFGCAQPWQRPVPELGKQVPSPVDQSLVEERINRVKKALERRDLTPSERTVLYSLVEAYQGMENLPVISGERAYYKETIRRLFFALSSMEDLYLDIRSNVGTKDHSTIKLLDDKTNEIFDSYLAGNYKAVINQCIQLKQKLGSQALTPEVSLVFALSLAEQGMIKDAIAIGEQIANRLQTRPDLVALRAHLAKWHLSIGDREAAMRNYEKLADLLDERERSKERLSLLLGKAAGVKGGTSTSDIMVSTKQASKEAEAQQASILPIDEFLAKVQDLINQRKFERARDLLKKRRHQTTSQKELERLAEAIKEVDTQEDRFLQTRISLLSKQSELLADAESLIEKENYDQALTKLDLIAPELRENVEVARLRNRAIEGIINRDRNKAAKLFLAARQCKDPEKKEWYLRSCLEILKALVDKYPTSPLIYKVKDHIKKVTEELEKLG